MFTMVKACEMYPKPQLNRDPALKDDAEVVIPFVEIPGANAIKLLCRSIYDCKLFHPTPFFASTALTQKILDYSGNFCQS
jgi:hypothetical protein